MDPFTGSILAAGIGGIADIFGQEAANKANRRAAREQMDFQREMAHSAQAFSERMSSTAVQRAVADYKAAGLNPALAYGQTASSPAGVTAGGAAARSENVMRNAPQLASTALSLKSMAQEIQQSKERRKDEHDLMFAQAQAAYEAARKTGHESALLTQQWRFNETNQPNLTRIQSAEAYARELALDAQKNSSDFEKMLAEKLRGGGSTARGIFQAINALRQLIGR